MSALPRVTLAAASTRPTLDFVLPGLLSGSVGLIVGQGAIGKSFLALQIGLAVASGKAIAGGLWPAPVRGPVTLVFGEDQPDLIRERLFWLRQQESIDEDDAAEIDTLLDIRSAYGHDMRILQRAGAALGAGAFLGELQELADGQRLLIIDPLAFLSDGDENDNGSMTRLMQTLQAVSRETGCTIIVLHHVSKGGAGEREEWTAARGASALTTACRWQVNLAPVGKEEMKKYGIDEAMRASWVRVAVVKSNYGEPPPDGWLRRVKGGVLRFEQVLKVLEEKDGECESLAGRFGLRPLPRRRA